MEHTAPLLEQLETVAAHVQLVSLATTAKSVLMDSITKIVKMEELQQQPMEFVDVHVIQVIVVLTAKLLIRAQLMLLDKLARMVVPQLEQLDSVRVLV